MESKKIQWRRIGHPAKGYTYFWNGWKIKRDPERPTVWRAYRSEFVSKVFHTLPEAKRYCEAYDDGK